jgi:hypothetical protein
MDVQQHQASYIFHISFVTTATFLDTKSRFIQ